MMFWHYLINQWIWAIPTIIVLSVLFHSGDGFKGRCGPGYTWCARRIAARRTHTQVLRRVEMGDNEEAWIDQ